MTPLERIAHDIICICKYGSPGGSASATEIKRVTDYLSRLGSLPAATPRVVIAKPVPAVKVPDAAAVLKEFKVQVPTVLPSIKLPGTP